MNGMIQWHPQGLLVSLLDESVFLNEWFKDKYIFNSPFLPPKKKDAHTGIDRQNWILNFTTSIRFLTLSIRFWNWNWFSISKP